MNKPIIGDVILCKPNGKAIQNIICKVTKSKYCHVGIITDVSADNKYFIMAEAINNGFVYNSYNTETKLQTADVYRSKRKLYDVSNIINKYIGKPYGWMQLIAILIKKYTGLNISKDGIKHLICSEAVARVLYDASKKKINFEEEFFKPYDYITPEDISKSKFLKKVL